MRVYNCSQCQGVRFTRLEEIVVGTDGKAIETRDTGILRCGNCGQNVTVEENGTVAPVEVAAQKHVAGMQVRSSVSADARRVYDRSEPRKM